MQITIVSKNDLKGGAAIAALRLHKAFRIYSSKLQINSKMKELKKRKNKEVEPQMTSFMVKYNIKDLIFICPLP